MAVVDDNAVFCWLEYWAFSYEARTPNSTDMISKFTSRVSEVLTQLKRLGITVDSKAVARVALEDNSEIEVLFDLGKVLTGVLCGQCTFVHKGHLRSGRLINLRGQDSDSTELYEPDSRKFFRRDIYINEYLVVEKCLRAFGPSCLRTQNLVRLVGLSGVMEEQPLSICDTLRAFSNESYYPEGSSSTWFGYQLKADDGWRDFCPNAIDYTVLTENKVDRSVKGLYFLDNYHTPYKYGVPNKYFSNYSRDLLRMKEGNDTQSHRFAESLKDIIRLSVPIVTIPSSDSSVTTNGIRAMAKKICLHSDKGIDATHCLVRHTSVQAMHDGGDRAGVTHLNSICVQDERRVAGKLVLLLDDITTSGNSLLACEQLLLRAGAKHVVKLALGKTWK